VIGVPFDQDARIGRTTCGACGKAGPPNGHVNSFTREKLLRLFPDWRARRISYVGSKREATTALAAWLMDLGGNPWGTYDQEESCIHCGSKLAAPGQRPLLKTILSALAARMNLAQALVTRPSANWIHILFGRQA